MQLWQQLNVHKAAKIVFCIIKDLFLAGEVVLGIEVSVLQLHTGLVLHQGRTFSHGRSGVGHRGGSAAGFHGQDAEIHQFRNPRQRHGTNGET